MSMSDSLAVIQRSLLWYVVYGTALYLLAVFHLAQTPMLIALTLVAAIGWLLSIRKALRLEPLIKALRRNRPGVICAIILALLGAHVFLIPPFMADDMIYHLLVPQWIARTGGMAFDPYNINANFPMLFEMPLIVMAKISWLSPFLLNAVVVTALAAAYYRIGRTRYSLPVPLLWTGVLLLCSTPLIYEMLHSAYVEIFFSLTLLVAVVNYVDYIEDRRNQRAWIWSALLLGTASATKYFCLLFAAPILMVEFFLSKNRAGYYRGILLLIVIAAPWYLKNWIVLGNPVFPLANSLFDSPYISPFRLKAFYSLPQSYNMGKEMVDYLLLPLRLLCGMHMPSRDGAMGFGGTLSCFFLLCFAGIGFRKPRELVPTLVFIGYLCIWLLTGQQVRYLLPALIPITLAGLERLSRLWARRKPVIVAVVVLIGGQNCLNIAKSIHADRIDALMQGKISRSEFLTGHMPISFPIAQIANKVLDPTRTRILTLSTYGRNYYFDVPTLSVTYFDTEPFVSAYGKRQIDPDRMHLFLTRNRITHLLFNPEYVAKLHPDEPFLKALRDYLISHSRVIAEEGNIVLIELP
jgi:hypothetical protein